MDKTILLIDDDRDEFLLLREALLEADASAHCRWAEGADHIGEELQQCRPDYILIDINMPKINGLACLDIIRTTTSVSHVPVIMYSTSINEDTRIIAMKKGADECVEKPASFLSLVRLLSRIICL